MTNEAARVRFNTMMPPMSAGHPIPLDSHRGKWWARQGLNLRPHPCEVEAVLSDTFRSFGPTLLSTNARPLKT